LINIAIVEAHKRSLNRDKLKLKSTRTGLLTQKSSSESSGPHLAGDNYSTIFLKLIELK